MEDEARWLKVALLQDVPPGTLKSVRVGQRSYAVVNVEGEIHALLNDCPHRGGSLAGGRLLGQEVACAWHGFRFDARTGEATMPRDHDPATTVAVRVVDGSIELAALPSSAAAGQTADAPSNQP